MAVTEKRTEPGLSAKIWSIGVRQVVYAALGAALYGGFSYLTNILPLPSTSQVSFRPAIVIPLFFGVVFGPWVGLFTGGVGNLLGDFITGWGFFWTWDVGNGLVGFIAGLAMYLTWGRYKTARNIAIADVFSAAGLVIGLAVAAYPAIWLEKYTFAAASGNYIPALLSGLVNGLILLPIFLVAYNAAVRRTGRA